MGETTAPFCQEHDASQSREGPKSGLALMMRSREEKRNGRVTQCSEPPLNLHQNHSKACHWVPPAEFQTPKFWTDGEMTYLTSIQVILMILVLEPLSEDLRLRRQV